MSDNSNGGIVLKWAHLILILLIQILLLGAVWGSLSFQVADHARRLDAIEKKQEDNFIPRSEYDKRHEDLIQQMRELREQLRDLERKVK